MVKKTKGVEVSLYNFNADDEDNKKNKKSKKKKSKKVKETKTKQQDNGFDFDNEIVIGLTRLDEKEDSKNKKSKKKSNKKLKNSKENKKKVAKKNNKKTKKVVPKKEKEVENKKKKRNFKFLKYLFLIICVLSAIIATMASPLFNVKQIDVEGNKKITKDEIISLSQIELEQNTYKINISKTKQKILENPYIKSVQIKRNLPSNITITVEERTTTFMIEYGSGYVYINNQGYILEISTEKLDIPILQGAETATEDFVPGNRLCTNDLEKMSTVIKIMEVASNNDIASLISRIDIENKQNYKIVFDGEQKIAYLGDETDLSTKILSIKAILERESGIAGEIFVNMDLKINNPTFRQSV